MNRTIIYILAMALTSLIVRALPITLINKKINNSYIKSFLYYVPYVTLAVMTFPTIIQTTSTPLIGMIVFVLAIILSYERKNMITVALACCTVTFILQAFF